MPEITLQVELARGMTIAFVEAGLSINSTPERMNPIVDGWMKVIGRQKAKLDLAERIIARGIAEKQLATLPDALVEAERVAATQIAAIKAGWELRIENRRTPKAMPQQMQQQIDKIAEGLEQTRKDNAASVKGFKGDLVIIDGEIERLKRVIAGEDDEPPTGSAPLAEAAD